MPRYAYVLTDGLAHDMRFVRDDYALQPGEVEGFGEPLPDCDAMSLKEAVDARDKARDIAAKRDAAIASITKENHDKLLESAVASPNAPPEVAAYVASIKGV